MGQDMEHRDFHLEQVYKIISSGGAAGTCWQKLYLRRISSWDLALRCVTWYLESRSHASTTLTSKSKAVFYILDEYCKL